MIRVLHVTECYEAGTGHAVDTIVAATGDLEHHLLFDGREGPQRATAFGSVRRLVPGPARRVAQVLATVRDLDPDVLHAHSSWAGVYARILPLSVPVVYQPHCYPFEDVTRPRWQRAGLRQAERVLAGRTAAVVAVSPWEGRLAASLRPGTAVMQTSNPPSVPVGTRRGPAAARSAGRPRVVTVGRISPQKDPGLFGRIAADAGVARLPFEFVWVGDGDATMRAGLVRAGVTVTGWLPGRAVADELDSSTVYLHTACYEGFPLTVVNAAARRVPILARRIPAFDGCGLPQFGGAEEAVGLLGSLLADPLFRERAVSAGDRLLERGNAEDLARTLRALYQQVGRRQRWEVAA